MALILGRYAQAREDGYFKQEQEIDIQELRKRLIQQGRFTEDYLGEDAFNAVNSSDDISPVLMEVLQTSARMSVPSAAKLRVWELRQRAGLPPLPEAELAKAIRKIRLGAAALLVPEELSLSTRKSWRTARHAAQHADPSAAALPPPGAPSMARASPHPAASLRGAAMTPEEQALANRQAAVALRGAAYGTMAGIVLVGAAATAFAASCGVWSADDARGALKRWGQSWREPIREAVAPVATWARSWARRPD